MTCEVLDISNWHKNLLLKKCIYTVEFYISVLLTSPPGDGSKTIYRNASLKSRKEKKLMNVCHVKWIRQMGSSTNRQCIRWNFGWVGSQVICCGCICCRLSSPSRTDICRSRCGISKYFAEYLKPNLFFNVHVKLLSIVIPDPNAFFRVAIQDRSQLIVLDIVQSNPSWLTS